MNNILESIEPVVKKSKYVKINEEKIKNFCENFNSGDVKYWTKTFNFSDLDDEAKLNFIFVFDSLNFCYWGEPKWSIEYQGKQYSGAYGMIGSLRRALDSKKPILAASYLADITKEDLAEVLAGDTEIPLFEERLVILHENGKILEQKYNGHFANVVSSSDGDALRLLDTIVSDFPSFNDVSTYSDSKVLFHKRAQIAVADAYRMFKGKGPGALKNTEQLTAFADYRIPQVLRRFGILEYSHELAEKVDNRALIPKDSEEEVEIRANSVWAVELMRKGLKEKNIKTTAMEIDANLWLQGKRIPEDKPHHLTRTIYY